MRRKRLLFGLTVSIAVLAVFSAVALAVLKVGHPGWAAWAGAVLSALVAGVAASSKNLLATLSEQPLGLLRQFMERNAPLRSVPGHGVRVDESADRVTLGVHPAIPLPASAPAGLSDEFPVYVPRDIDADVRTWLRSRASGGCLVVLVGPAAAGKTRLLAEALHAELPGWQLLRPDSQQVNALVEAGADLTRSVLWLDELQNFFTGEPLSGTAVGALLSGHHGPVVLAATIRGAEVDRLMSRVVRAIAGMAGGFCWRDGR
jgi:hypothetical protein